MENIFLRILDFSLSVGVSFFMLYFFMKKLNERDKFVRDLIEEMHTITEKFNISQERIVQKLQGLSETQEDIQRDINAIKNKIEVLNEKMK